MLAHVNKDGPTPEERRFRAAAILLVGAVALTLLGVWAVILRRAPIEEDLTSRSAAILENAGIDATGLHFDGRDGSVTVEASLAADAGRVLASLDGLRVIVISSAAPPVTTTTTVPITTTTTAATTTTTTIPVPEARFTLTSLAGQVTLSVETAMSYSLNSYKKI